MTSMTWDEYFIGFARWAAMRSTCVRRQVGAILVKDKRIVSTGYNGVATKAEHCNTYFKDLFETKHKDSFKDFDAYTNSDLFYKEHGEFSENNELHAEMNCLAYSPKYLENCELFVTLSPCRHCAKILLAHKITRVVYENKYDRDDQGIITLQNNGVNVEQFGWHL